jgi:hypothetical protein
VGTKNNPGRFDCYAAALPDEPIFVLLARDPNFFQLVSQWADRRWRDIRCGDRPESDVDVVKEAKQCAIDGQTWRRMHNGIWRRVA